MFIKIDRWGVDLFADKYLIGLQPQPIITYGIYIHDFHIDFLLQYSLIKVIHQPWEESRPIMTLSGKVQMRRHANNRGAEEKRGESKKFSSVRSMEKNGSEFLIYHYKISKSTFDARQRLFYPFSNPQFFIALL